MKPFLFLLILLILFGCNNPQPANNAPPVNNTTPAEKYQLVASQNGNVYRLDKTSGEVWMIKDSIMQQVGTEQYRLKVNQQYIGEDLYIFTYLGKGQLGKIKTIDDFRIEDNDPLGILEKNGKPKLDY